MKKKSRKQLIEEAKKMLDVIEKEDSEKWVTTVEKLVPALYSLAIMGAASSIMAKGLQEMFKEEKKKKSKKKRTSS